MKTRVSLKYWNNEYIYFFDNEDEIVLFEMAREAYCEETPKIFLSLAISLMEQNRWNSIL